MRNSTRDRNKQKLEPALPVVKKESWFGPALNSRDWWICAAILGITLLAFGNVFGHEFISLDDDPYIMHNRLVQNGLTWEGLGWALTSVNNFYWHPLTWISHMAVCELFGVKAGWHHFVNLLIHACNGVLLFLALRRLTGAVYKSAAVAAIFVVHPLRVESVAWVAERKDVLAIFFTLLTVLAYANYARNTQSIRRYLGVAALFLCALASKPAALTVPALLLVLDFWPLDRVRRETVWPLLREKLPFFAMSIGCFVLTTIAQRSFIALVSKEKLSTLDRILNVPMTYFTYVYKTFWPHPLSLFYPYRPIPVWVGITGWIALAAITAVALRSARVRPYVTAGWIWFMVALVPTIWITDRWDRFSYLPSVGLLTLIVWGTAALAKRWNVGEVSIAALAGAVLLFSGCVTRIQVGYWHDKLALFQHTVEVAPDNVTAQNNLGRALLEKGRNREAIAHLAKAVAVDPEHPMALKNLGNGYFALGEYAEAEAVLKRAVQAKPDWGDARFDLAMAQKNQGRSEEARAGLEEALRYPISIPVGAFAHLNLGLILANQQKLEAASKHFAEALVFDPRLLEARRRYGITLAMLGRRQEAYLQLSAVLKAAPSDQDALAAMELLQTTPLR